MSTNHGGMEGSMKATKTQATIRAQDSISPVKTDKAHEAEPPAKAP